MRTTTRIATIVTLLPSTMPAFAEGDEAKFYDQKITVADPYYKPPAPGANGERNWHIYGGPKSGHVYCKAQLNYPDGSQFIIGQDFTDPEVGVYFYVHNVAWDIKPTEPPAAPWPTDKTPLAMKVQTNAYSKSAAVYMAERDAKALNKNSVLFPKLDPKDVYRILAKAIVVKFIMPSSFPNASVTGISQQIAAKLTECFDIVRKQVEANKQHPDDKDDAEAAAFAGEKKDQDAPPKVQAPSPAHDEPI